MHKVCVADRIGELMNVFQVSNETAAEIEVNDDGVATWIPPGGGEEDVITHNVTVCSLAKELDNVGMII